MTLYFDITDMLGFAIANPVCTGIQRGQLRVVGSTYDRGEDVGGFLKHPLTHKWRAADLSFLAGGYNYNREDFLSRFEIDDTKELWLMKKTRKHAPGSLVHTVAWKYNKIRMRLSPKLRRKNWNLPNKKSCLSELKLNRTDILASIGTWGVDYDASFALAVENHCKTVTFVHDIFPMTDGRHKGE